MPPIVDLSNLYSEAGAGHFSPAVSGALERVYVPEVRANKVDVIDPANFNVVDQFKAGPKPQHVIPSWDLKTLWVAGSGRRRSPGSLTPIDPLTGKPGATIRVPDAYNMYFICQCRNAAESIMPISRLMAGTQSSPVNLAPPL
jgi:DNA-binding beta-propeller fold protein YncE